jgi:hypothetical protein
MHTCFHVGDRAIAHIHQQKLDTIGVGAISAIFGARVLTGAKCRHGFVMWRAAVSL